MNSWLPLTALNIANAANQLDRTDLVRGWYHCPGCGCEVMVWPREGEVGPFGEPPQTERDLCTECEP